MKPENSTTLPGLSDAEVAELLRPISEVESATDARDLFARVAWSGIAEPGDRLSGMLCGALGHVEALNALVARTDASALASAVAERSDTDTQGLEQEIADAFSRWTPRLSENDARGHAERAARVGARAVIPSGSLWPQRLNDLGAHAPHVLWFRGQALTPEFLERSVSIVGARASTGYGEHITMDLVSGLVDRRVAIISGGAYGIDGMAHRAAIAGTGITVAVLAGGIDRLYPSGHDALLKRIIETGIVVSELPCGFAPTKWRFLQRNRLIAAWGASTIVVEAGWRSGSLNTAHHALELDRPVGVVPGPVTSPASAGCHRLLRETPAVCVTNASDVMDLAGITSDVPVGALDIVAGEADQGAVDRDTSVDSSVTRVCDSLTARRPRRVEDIARASGLSYAETVTGLGLARLNGLVAEREGGWVRVLSA